MGPHIGDTAPDFTTDTSMGKFTFHDWIGRTWVFFFSHTGDFAPVRTTEIGRTAQLADAQQITIPADGLPGGTVIIPTSIDDAEAKALFPQGWAEVCPNLRATKL